MISPTIVLSGNVADIPYIAIYKIKIPNIKTNLIIFIIISLITFPVSSTFGFFNISSNSSLKSFTNNEATPGLVCKCVIQIWILQIIFNAHLIWFEIEYV